MKSCNIAAYPIAKARGLRGGFSIIEALGRVLDEESKN